MTEHDDIARRLREAVETTPARDEDIDVIAANARRRRTVRRAVTTGVTAVLVVVAVVTVPGLVRRLDRPDRIELADRPAATPSASAIPSAIPSAAASPAGDPEPAQLPPSPIDARWDVFSASTGDELLIWGGYAWGDDEGPRSDGAAYDGSRWSELPEGPLSARWGVAGVAAWTGDELWIVGGLGGDDGRTPMRDAAAYDPEARTWRALPPVPETINGGAWAGDQLVVVAIGSDGSRSSVYALPAEGDRWREVGALPPPSSVDSSDLHVLAAGSQVAVVGIGEVFVRDLGSEASDWEEVPAPGGADSLPNVRGAVAQPGAIVVLLPDGTYRYDFGGAWSRIAGGLDPDPPQPIPLLHTGDGALVAVDVVNGRIHALSGDGGWTALTAMDEWRVVAAVEVVGGQIVVWGGMGSEKQGVEQGMTLQAPR